MLVPTKSASMQLRYDDSYIKSENHKEVFISSAQCANFGYLKQDLGRKREMRQSRIYK